MKYGCLETSIYSEKLFMMMILIIYFKIIKVGKMILIINNDQVFIICIYSNFNYISAFNCISNKKLDLWYFWFIMRYKRLES